MKTKKTASLMVFSLILLSCLLVTPMVQAVVYGVEYWTYSETGMYNAIGGRPDMAFYPVIKDGFTSILLNHSQSYIDQYNPTVVDREINGMFTSIEVGDVIDFKATFKTEASSFSDTYIYCGASIGIDLYVDGGRLAEINTPDGTPTYPTYPADRICVPDGSDWTAVEINFTVQAQYLGDTWGVAPDQLRVPIGFIAFASWGSSEPVNETAQMWIKDITMSINGEDIVVVSPTPTPTATATPIVYTQELSVVENPSTTLFYFLAFIAFLIASAVIAFAFFPIYGVFAGILGFIGVWFFYSSGYIIISVVTDPVTHIITTSIMPLGWIIMAPVVMCILNLLMPAIRKGK